MKSPKNPGNLRDFHIDERLPEGSSFRAPSQSIRSRIPDPLDDWRDQDVRNTQAPLPVTPAKPAPVAPTMAASSLSESHMGDAMWSHWEQEASGAAAGSFVDLSEPVTTVPASHARRVSQPLTSNLRESVPAPHLSPRSAPSPLEEDTLESGAALSKEGPSPGSLPWSTELAFEERRMERAGTVDYTNQYQKQEILRARTREFTALLQKTFREHVELFNESRRSPGHQIHVYKVSKTDEDFMLYRNSVKLAISGQRAGRILFAFNQYMGQIFAPTQAPVVEIEASWGPFDQLFWSYKGERVQVMDLVRYFLTEFVRQSFR